MDYLLHHLLITSVNRNKYKEAIADKETMLTYDQLSQKVGFVTNRLLESGIKSGDRVAFYLDHNVGQAITILAISASGGAFVPINALLYPEQVFHIVKDSGARILITTEERKNNLAEFLVGCPQLEHIWSIKAFDGEQPLERTCRCIENDLAAILYTSGSTGSPKGVMLSHKNLLAGCFIVSEYLQLSDKDRILGLLPLSFDYGLNQFITMIALGGTYRFLSFQFPNEIVNALAKYEITGLAGVPPIWALLVRSSLARTPLPHLRYITNSGGALPTQIIDLLKKALPTTQIFLMYGLTEAFRSTFLPPSELERRPTSMGKAIPNTEILVVSGTSQVCRPNEVGELVHRGPTVSMGYWKRPDATAESFRPHPLRTPDDMERVVYSGDLVQFDEEGFLYFVGRRDAMIKCSGYRISPSEIEEVAFKSGLIKEVAAIGIPDPSAGQVVKLFVIPLNKSGQASEELATDIINFCTKHLPNYMLPREVETVSSIPKTTSGKIDYPALKAKG